MTLRVITGTISVIQLSTTQEHENLTNMFGNQKTLCSKLIRVVWQIINENIIYVSAIYHKIKKKHAVSQTYCFITSVGEANPTFV